MVIRIKNNYHKNCPKIIQNKFHQKLRKIITISISACCAFCSKSSVTWGCSPWRFTNFFPVDKDITSHSALGFNTLEPKWLEPKWLRPTDVLLIESNNLSNLSKIPNLCNFGFSVSFQPPSVI